MKKIIIWNIFSLVFKLGVAQNIHYSTDVFSYNGFSVYHYGLGWYFDPAASAYGPMSYYTAFGGHKFFTGGLPRGVWDVNGNLGVGTLNPTSRLDVTGNIHVVTPGYGIYTGGQGTYIGWNKSGGQGEVNLVNSVGGGLGGFAFDDTSDGTTFTRLMTILGSGYVGIGTTNPDAKLAVKGTIHANEVKVDLNVPGPDYVFKKGYNLPGLKYIKTFVDQNKHLPEIPSAEEMEKNGMNLSEMNMLLLKKVEELTLYIIRADQERTKQQHEINKLKKHLHLK